MQKSDSLVTIRFFFRTVVHTKQFTMKKIFFPAFLVILFGSCTKQSGTYPVVTTIEERTGHVEIHVVVLNKAGDLLYGDSSFTFHLSPDYKTNGTDSAAIVNQLIHVNQVVNHGAPKDIENYPYTGYYSDSTIHGNVVTENTISAAAISDKAGVDNWVRKICDKGYAVHTHIETNTKCGRLKIIYPNL